jgi:hypothetical protein
MVQKEAVETQRVGAGAALFKGMEQRGAVDTVVRFGNVEVDSYKACPGMATRGDAQFELGNGV